MTTGSPDQQSGQAAPTSTGCGAGACTLPSSLAEILETECRLRVARAERERSSQPPPEYHGPHDQHAAANQAEFEKRKLRGACFACHQSGVQYDVRSGLFVTWQRSHRQAAAGPLRARLHHQQNF